MVSTIDVTEVVKAVRAACRCGNAPIPVHGPAFDGNEWRYTKDCVDTAWVSTAGSFVNQFEEQLRQYTGAQHTVAVINGTSALHVALQLAGVKAGDEVLVPSLTFVATANAVSYCGAIAHLCDADPSNLGLDVDKLAEHLARIAERRQSGCFNKQTGRRISAVLPMHALGHPVAIAPLLQLAAKWQINVVEDAAESLGSFYDGRHTGTFGLLGILSFNSNKIVTTGGGGAILTNNDELGAKARHLTSTAKLPHPWEYIHDEVGYNYRLPNINAALGCAQMERLPNHLQRKRVLAQRYFEAFGEVSGVSLISEPEGCASNYWLNTILLERADPSARDALLKALNDGGLQSRPVWRPMHQLPMYESCPRMDLSATEDLAKRAISLPSSPLLVRDGELA